MSVVYEKGINDMPYGWASENEWNRKVYQSWCLRLQNVYSEKRHEKRPTYIDSTLCLEWHWLSSYVNDITKIDGYDCDKFMNGEIELDKDIKSNGKNKEYSLENCMFVSSKENAMQAVSTRNNDYMKGENNWNHGGISDETKRKMKENHADFKREKHPQYGTKRSEESKRKQSEKMKRRRRTEESKKKQSESTKGKRNKNCWKSCIQYDLNGKFIKRWNCAKDASEELGINYSTLLACLQGRLKNTITKNGERFKWEYEN